MTIFVDAAPWRTFLKGFFEQGLGDIYFDYDYTTLNLSIGAKAEAFVWQEHEHTFMIPYIVQPIPGGTQNAPLYDFTTAYGYSGPLSTTDEEGFLERSWDAFRQYCHKARIVNGFIRFHPLLRNFRFALPEHVSVIKDRQTVVVDLPATTDELLQSYWSGHRSEIQRGTQSGIHVEQVDGHEHLLRFAKLYEERMAELGARNEYFFGSDYFQAIDSLGRDRYSLFFAHLDDRLSGGLLALYSNQFAHYHLASSSKKDLPMAPNKILLHALLTSEVQRGSHRRIHLGGGRTPDPQDSLFRFKSGFSDGRADFYVGKFIASPELHATICAQWDKDHPELAAESQSYLQRYRMTLTPGKE